MSHQVQSLAYHTQGGTPWHGIGTAISEKTTIDEVLAASGLDWRVDLVQLATVDTHDIVSHNAVRRLNLDGSTSLLGVTGPGSVPLQNRDAFAIVQPWIDSGEARFDCAGSLFGGRRVFVSVKLAHEATEIVPGDPVHSYALLAHAHDGSLAIRFGLTGVRVVCHNTFRQALDDASSQFVRVLHRKGAVASLHAARDLIDASRGAWKLTTENFRAMAARPVTSKQIRKIVTDFARTTNTAAGKEAKKLANIDDVLDMVAMPETAQAVEKTAMDDLIDRITENMEVGRGSEIPGVTGTVWGLYNALTEEVQHERAYRTAETRADAVLFGDAARASEAAYRACMRAIAA